VRALAATACLVLAAAAQAQPANVQSCTGCHGAHGEGGSTGAPRLAGQPMEYLARQLAAYADGRREHSVMTPIAKGLQPQDRQALAAYYAGLQAPATPPQLGNNNQGDAGRSANHERGRTLAMRGDEAQRLQACANCHGPAGSGQHGLNPYLAGLDRRYLEAALTEWKSGSRKTDPSQQMTQIAKNLSEADIQALAAYFARQPAPQVAERTGNADAARGASAPTRPGAATQPAEGVGATGGEATTGGSQGQGGGGGASGSGPSGSR
jgi:cytochrome c553